MLTNNMINKPEPTIRKKGIAINYTNEQIQEIIKCSKDPIYFIENYCYIVHPVKGVVLCELYPFQKRVIYAYMDNQHVIGNFSRQCGKSMLSNMFCLWYAIFNPQKTVMQLFINKSSAKHNMEKVKVLYEFLPMWLKPGVENYNNNEIYLENGSYFVSDFCHPSSCRGEEVALLYLDEFAFVNEKIASEFYKSVRPCIISDFGKCIISSTPNEASGTFYELYTGALADKNMFIPITVRWDEHPDRDDSWEHEFVKNFGKKSFEQEYCNKFVSV